MTPQRRQCPASEGRSHRRQGHKIRSRLQEFYRRQLYANSASSDPTTKWKILQIKNCPHISRWAYRNSEYPSRSSYLTNCKHGIARNIKTLLTISTFIPTTNTSLSQLWHFLTFTSLSVAVDDSSHASLSNHHHLTPFIRSCSLSH